MPIIIISNIPMIYQFVLHTQYLSVISATSIGLVCCKAIFATNVFNFDCLHTVYITTKVVIIVTNAAEKGSTSTRKLLRKEPNLESFLALSISLFSFSSNIFFLLLYWVTRSFSVFGALCKFGLISKVSTEIGSICSWVVQFFKTGIPKSPMAF